MAQLEHTAGWPILNHYSGDKLQDIGFPLGGIGTGAVSLGGRAELRDFEIFNTPAKGFNPPYCFFALRCEAAGREPVDARAGGRAAAALWRCLWRAHTAGRPAAHARGAAGCRLSLGALYPEPIPTCRWTIALEAFNPLVPLDVEAPACRWPCCATCCINPTNAPVGDSVAGSLYNCIGSRERLLRPGPTISPGGLGRLLGGNENCGDRAAPSMAAAGGPADALRRWWRRARRRTARMALVLLGQGATYAAHLGPTQLEPAHPGFLGRLQRGRAAGGPGRGRAEPRGPGADRLLGERAGTRAGRDGPPHLPAVLAFPAPHGRGLRLGTRWPRMAAGWATTMPLATRTPGTWLCRWLRAWRSWRRHVRFADAPGLHQPASGGEGGGAEQRLHPAHPDLLPHRRRGLLRLRGLLRRRPAAATAPAPTCGTTSRPPPSSSPAGRSMRDARVPQRHRPSGLKSSAPSCRSAPARWRQAAADGQMGVVMKLYREWQLRGDDDWLRAALAHVQARAGVRLGAGRLGRRPGRRDGGRPAQHLRRRVLRPEPADRRLVPGRAARRRGDGPRRGRRGSPPRCRELWAQGSPGSMRTCSTASTTSSRSHARSWARPSPGLRIGMGETILADPTFQLGAGCLVDQLVGQYMAHVPGWATCSTRRMCAQALASLYRYNFKPDLHAHATTCAPTR